MDFFDRQEKSRRRTAILLVYFIAAVLLTAALVYVAFMLLGFFSFASGRTSSSSPFVWWHPLFFLITFLVTLGVIGLGSLFKIIELRGGGARIAEKLGGRCIQPNADDFYERRLLNVVEEMAIASGMTVPPVYLLTREDGINAFAAGYSSRDAIVAVTRGAMIGLSRDELQGVIAHEFSHILNGDMRMNIHLMGGLHGLLLISLIARSIFHLRIRGRGGAVIYIAAAVLLAVGGLGLFFGKLIKSAVSRQREFLADAAAVQFTRNPAGLAGALKKIGGLSLGSRILTPQADTASHMFFGDGMRGSSFATHPPLKERVRWLEPSFNGIFESVTQESLYQALAENESAPKPKEKQKTVVDVLTRPTDLVVAGAVLQNPVRKPRPTAASSAPRNRNPQQLMDTIGAPMQEHIEAASQLIASIPSALKEQARDPYGVRAIVYLLLLDDEDAVRETQLETLRTQADPTVVSELEKIRPFQGQLRPEARLPLFDLAMPALKLLSKNQYLPFKENVQRLMDADQRISIFEYALQRMLLCHLDPLFDGDVRQKSSAGHYAFCGVEQEISCILSALAHLNEFPEAAFKAATEKIPDARAQFTLRSKTESGWERLSDALDKLGHASFFIKKWTLASGLVCLMHDREVTTEEVELFRAIADSLDCPVPPWLSVATLDD